MRMKHLARSHVWWYKIDNDIEKLVANCNDCNAFRNEPTKVTHIWEPCTVPFERVHIDFAGPFLGHYFFILVDAFSKWPEVHIVKDMTARTTINLCRQIFATFGLPSCIVSDNGRTFISKEFRDFLQRNGIAQKLTAPYHPATNGQAERYVQIFKNALKKMRANTSNVQTLVPRILLQYRTTIHAATGKTPAELLFLRKLHTRLDLLRPSTKFPGNNYMAGSTPISFEEGKRVSCRNYAGNERWLSGTVLQKLGLLHYKVQLDDGRVWKRHANQMRKIGEATRIEQEEDDFSYSGPPSVTSTDRSTTIVSADACTSGTNNESSQVVENNTNDSSMTITTPSFSTITASERPDTTCSSPVRQETEFSPRASTTRPLTTSTPVPSPEIAKSVTMEAPNITRPTRERKPPLYLKDYVVLKNFEID
ncbi:PREDICTED: uncharacterized protein K02A2.6-like [Vollenhovia emeryi]|uniref:uncharacterized protein K02A2.6-like n=1 Tax=Vollenhovia emeryi TaxID=411798 RepID=UPI0005F46983|nr:PREDICTED: uncharacterized protein K02A2.6-like [Vollenhovia emeryi]